MRYYDYEKDEDEIRALNYIQEREEEEETIMIVDELSEV